MIESYPLHWPVGWKRLGNFAYRDPSRFTIKSFAKLRDGLIHEVELLGGKNIILSSNLPLRRDGLPYSKFSQPKDPGVAVYFNLKKKSMVFACDQYPKVEENMHSVRKTIQAIRGIKRWGASDMLERAFAGFQALDAPKKEEWWEILGVSENITINELENAKRNKARIHHPDVGGTNEMMAKINKAYDDGRQILRH